MGSIDEYTNKYNYFKLKKHINSSIHDVDTHLIKEFVNEYKKDVSQHERTRQHISDKLQELIVEMATKDDIIKSKNEIIHNIKNESAAMQKILSSEIAELKANLLSFLPYKRSFRISFYFVMLFLFFQLSDIFLNIHIIEKFWGLTGLFVSAGFLVMSYFLLLDWNKKNNEL